MRNSLLLAIRDEMPYYVLFYKPSNPLLALCSLHSCFVSSIGFNIRRDIRGHSRASKTLYTMFYHNLWCVSVLRFLPTYRDITTIITIITQSEIYSQPYHSYFKGRE